MSYNDDSMPFEQRIDNMIKFAIECDPELLANIQWLDKLAVKEGVSIYEKIDQVLKIKDPEERAEEWNRQRNENS